MPYAALQRLMIPLREYRRRAPRRHQQALRVATGSAAGPPPDRFLVGLGMLGLLAAAGEVGAAWSARSTTPTSSTPSRSTRSPSWPAGSRPSRRPWCSRAATCPSSSSAMAGVPTLRLAGLPHEAAVRLLPSSLPEPIDPAAAAQIAAATGGNPLALIDLAVELNVKRLAESSLADEPIPVGHRLEAHYLRRVRLLSDDAAALAAGRRRRLHRQPRPDPGRRRSLDICRPRPGTRPRPPGWSSSTAPSGSGTRWSARRCTAPRTAPTAARVHARARRRRRPTSAPRRARGLARRQGDPRDRRGGGGPAGAGRRPGRPARGLRRRGRACWPRRRR